MKGSLLVFLLAILVHVVTVIGLSSRHPPAYSYGRPSRRRWYWKPLFIGKRGPAGDTTDKPKLCIDSSDCPGTSCCLRKPPRPDVTVSPEVTDTHDGKAEERNALGTCELTPLHGDLCVLEPGSWAGHLCPCENGSSCRPLATEKDIGLCWNPQK